MSTPTILCVDDERNVLLTLRTQLMRYFPDYAIEIAESGTEALIVIEELLNDGVEIPLVIADQIMPGMKGDKFLIELHSRYPQILKVMLTGEARAEDVGNVVNRGNLYRFISKPWNEIDLKLTVTEALRCYHKEQELTQKQLELEQANRELERLNAGLEQQIQERTQQLHQSERQLRLFIEHTPVSVAMFDRHMNYVIASHRWINDYQLMKRENQLDGSIIGKCHYDLFPNISDTWREAHQRGLQGIATRNEKDHCIFADGREEWLRWEVLPWYDDIDNNDTDNIAGLIIFGEIISDRIRTENALQESEERYRLLSEISPIGIFQYDVQGVATYANAKVLEITGLSLEDNLGEGWTKNLHPDDRTQISAAWKNFIELANLGCDTEYEVEQRYIYPDGSIKWMFVQAVPERDIHGKLIGFIGSVLDITNRKQVEAALRQSEAKQRALINALPDLIMRVSRDGVYLDFISTDTFKVLGDAQKLIGTKIEESLPPDLTARRMNAVHAALETREMQIYEQELWVDGALQTEECRVVVCGEDDVLIVGRDISARKQSERALKVSKKISETKSQQVYSLINNIPHIAWLKDLEGRFLAVNEPFAQSCGYEPAQLVGLTDLDIWTPELAESYRRDDLDVMQSRQRKQIEERLVNTEGKVIWIETFKAPVIDESNESIGTAGIAIDITDRKQADLAIQSLLHGTASVTGKEFFPELVKQIAIALGVSHVYLDRQVGDCLETLAWYANHQLQSKFVYKIVDTPCEVVLRQGSYYCSNVKNLFSLNEHLIGADIDSYLGVALQNAEGKKLGVLCVLDHQPLSNPKHAEMLLRIFGARAIAELERMQALEDLQNLNAELEYRVQERTKELSQTRNFLEAIIENLPVALFVKNGKVENFGEFLLWNRTSEIMFGCTKEQAIGKSVYDFFPKEQSDFFNLKDRDSFLFGQTEDIPEEPIDSLTLGRRILHTIKVPVFDEQGQPDYLICISEDITDRKQAEKNLQAERLRLQIALEAAEMGTWESNMDIGYWSNRTEEIFGYAPGTFPGDREAFLKLVYADDQERVFNALSHSFATQSPYNVEYRINHRNGEIRWVAVNGKVVQNDNDSGTRIVGVALDITDRKQAESALMASEERFRAAFEQAAVGIGQVDLNGYFANVNQKLCDILGYTETELLSKSLREISGPDDFAKEEEQINKLLTGEIPAFFMEKRYIHKDGHIIWTNLNVSLVHKFDGSPEYLLGVVQDISDRKQAEIALRQYERMVELAPDGMAVVDRNYIYRLVNQTYLEHNDWQKEQMIGYSLQDVMGEYTFHTIVKPRFDKCLAGEVIDYGDWVYFEKAGNRFVSAIYYPYFEIDGTITGVVIINRDVTERRKAEILLQDSEERLRLALTATNQGLYDLNPQTGATIVSPEYVTMLGYSPDEFQETIAKWIERLHPDELEPVTKVYRDYINGKIPNYKVEFRQRTKNGDWKWILSVGKIVQWDADQQPLRMLGTHTDISDRKLAESRLQEERLRLQLALDAAQMGCWGCNLQTGKLFWSDRAQEIFGFVPGTFPSDRNTFLAMVYPDDYDRVVKSINHTFATESPYQIEYRIRRLDGELRWIAVWGIIHQNQTDRQLIGVVEDISDRKHAELEREHLLENLSQLNSELAQANQQLGAYSQTLELRVEERTSELKAAQERILAQEKLVSLGTLTAGIAHEIRNPLNFVKNYAEGSIELAQDLMEILQPVMQSHTSKNNQLIEELIADLQENATTIRDHSQRADKIITSMMQHARTDNEQTTMHPTLLHDLLNEALKLSCQSKELQHSSFQVVIETKYSPEIGLVEVIPNNLIRAFINLIDNACDAMWFKQQSFANKGDASIHVPKLMIATQLVDDRVEIHIRDNGCGIDPKIQSRILDPFFTTKPPGSGTGLGLSLTHDIIVKQHQGDLKINSNIGEFTEIIVIIPLVMTGFK